VNSAAAAQRILVVDDEQDVATYLAVALEDHGYDVACANDAAAVDSELENHPPDLVCLDLVMPGDSGLRLYSEIRRRPGVGDRPILMISGVSDGAAVVEDVLREHHLPPAQGFVEKPVDIEALVARIREILAQDDDAEKEGS
jgi:two-component system OmpR family response regulator